MSGTKAADEVPEEERPGGIPVDEQDRLSGSFFQVVHGTRWNGVKPRLERILIRV